MIEDLIFYPPSIRRGQLYRFITHGFIHADAAHLAFNMLALYSFGQLLETQVFTYECFFGNMGKLYFLMLYFFGLIFASLPDYIKYKDSFHFRSLGASGAVSAVVFRKWRPKGVLHDLYALLPSGQDNKKYPGK